MMKQLKNDRYTYRLEWSEDDGQYVGLCTEFPSLSWLASTHLAAINGIRAVVAESVDDLRKNKEPIPEPIAVKHYSGKFQVRVPPEVHRRLALEAAEANISINRLVNAKLTPQQK